MQETHTLRYPTLLIRRFLLDSIRFVPQAEALPTPYLHTQARCEYHSIFKSAKRGQVLLLSLRYFKGVMCLSLAAALDGHRIQMAFRSSVQEIELRNAICIQCPPKTIADGKGRGKEILDFQLGSSGEDKEMVNKDGDMNVKPSSTYDILPSTRTRIEKDRTRVLTHRFTNIHMERMKMHWAFLPTRIRIKGRD